MFWGINISSKKRVKNQNSNFKKIFLKKELQTLLQCIIIVTVRDALHSYLNLAEATKIRLHAEFNTLSFMAGCFRFVKRIVL